MIVFYFAIELILFFVIFFRLLCVGLYYFFFKTWNLKDPVRACAPVELNLSLRSSLLC